MEKDSQEYDVDIDVERQISSERIAIKHYIRVLART